MRNNLSHINLYGAMYGLLNIKENYHLTIKDLVNLKHVPSKYKKANIPFTKEELSIWERVQTLKPFKNSLCEFSYGKDYAYTPVPFLKCYLNIAHLNIYYIEILHFKSPKIMLLHNYFSPLELHSWEKSFNQLNQITHMKSLYEIEANKKHLSEFQQFVEMLDFKREGKIGFFPETITTKKSEKKLKHILHLIYNYSMIGDSFENYQAGTYGIGGFIDEHLDTYGTPTGVMEDILDLSNGNNSFVFYNIQIYF